MVIQAQQPAWETLYARMGQSVRGKILRLLRPSGNSTYVDDVCQQFWLHLWKVGPSYWNPKGVNLISRQVTFKWLRKQKFSLHLVEENEQFDGDTSDQHDSGDRRGRNELAAPCLSELFPEIANIAALLLHLPQEQRIVFSFRYRIEGHEELTFNEIGQRMGMPPGEAAMIFSQAMKNILSMLGEVRNA